MEVGNGKWFLCKWILMVAHNFVGSVFNEFEKKITKPWIDEYDE